MLDMAASPRRRTFEPAKRDTPTRYCRKCELRFACQGECPKNRFIRTADGEPGLNYIWVSYKVFFRHVDRPMRIMIQLLRHGRAPAEIMALMGAVAPQPRWSRPSRPIMCAEPVPHVWRPAPPRFIVGWQAFAADLREEVPRHLTCMPLHRLSRICNIHRRVETMRWDRV